MSQINQAGFDRATVTDAPPAIVADALASIAAAAVPLPRMHANHGELARAITLATTVTEKRNSAPICGHVLIKSEGDAVTVTATDLDMVATVTVPAVTDAGFVVVVPAHTVRDAVTRGDADAIALQVESQPEKIEHSEGERAWYSVNPGKVALRFGASSVKLATALPSDWPKAHAFTAASTFELPADAFCAALRRSQFCVSTEETRYYLNGVYFHLIAPNGVRRYNGEHGTLRLVATDGHRLAQCEMPATAGTFGMPGVIIPRKTVAVVLKLWGKPIKAKKGEPTPPPTMLRVAVGPTGISFASGNVALVSKVINGTFPDYCRVIPAGNPHRLEVMLPDLTTALSRVVAVCSEHDRAVRLTMDSARLTLSVNNPDTGTTSESVECDYSGNPMDIGFNSRYLADILDYLTDGKQPKHARAERVTIMLADPGSPTLIKNNEAADRFYVLMPMRV